MNVVLEVNNLNKSYGNFSLKDVTFSLNTDCITGFIGTMVLERPLQLKRFWVLF